jgi:hypothetical protein
MVTIDNTTNLKAAHLPSDENDLSRRYLRMLEAWIPVGVESEEGKGSTFTVRVPVAYRD